MEKRGGERYMLRIGDFELDLRAGELRTDGRRVVLGAQPFRILEMLANRPAEMVTRREIRDSLWPDGTVVEFDHSINVAIKRLRAALGERAGEHQYIETVRGRGYRLTVPVMAETPIDSVAVLTFASEGKAMGFFSD